VALTTRIAASGDEHAVTEEHNTFIGKYKVDAVFLVEVGESEKARTKIAHCRQIGFALTKG